MGAAVVPGVELGAPVTDPTVTEISMGFRQVLHEWAKRQLEAHSDHAGPFEIVRVRLDQSVPGTFESREVEVDVEFRHDHVKCPYRNYDGSACRITVWSPLSGTTETVKLINELLAIADGS